MGRCFSLRAVHQRKGGSGCLNYLNGRIPTTDVLFRIARYSGRPMEWFLENEQGLPAVDSGEAPVHAATRKAA
jgi:hypothetical protein